MKKKPIVFLSLLALGLAACGRSPQQKAQENAQQQAQAAQKEAQQAEQQANKAEQQAREFQQKAQQARQRAQQAEQQESGNAAQARSPVRQQRPAQPAVTIPAGTDLRVRLDQALDTATSKEGDRFTATLSSPVVENGKVIIPQGARFDGTVTTSAPSGRFSGQAILALRLDSFTVNGRRYPVATTPVSRESGGHTKRDVGIIGGGAAAGAAIGGILGGGKGAAIGAGAGAAAGTATEAATGKLNVKIPAEALLSFKLESPLVLRG